MGEPVGRATVAPVRVAVVGFGYWGPNLARCFAETEGAELAAVCDLRPELVERARRRYPGVRVTTALDEVLADEAIDAVIVTTPVATHAPIGMAALERGKHLLVAKPIADSSAAAQRLVDAAEANGRVILVDHTFAYTGAVERVRQLVDDGTLGDLYYLDSVRVNLGLFQRDVSVVWDLAVHDLSIMLRWVRRTPRAVSCVGVAHVPAHPADVAYLTVMFADDLIAHVHVNWLSPVKIRRTLLGGSKRMVVYDDLEASEKVRVYDRGLLDRDKLVGSDQIPIAYRRTGDVWSPQLDPTEALLAEAAHFVDCVRHGAEPRTGAREATTLVRILEAAEQSMREQGRLIPLDLPA